MNWWGKAFVVALALAIAMVWFVVAAALLQASNGVHTLTVDGTVYAPTKIVGNGPTVHYYTPGTTPSVAYTERHTWTGNGSGNLPCEGTLHWIDNANVLTISHCEYETGTTTTTVITPTTTTLPPTTTTTQVVVTTTTRPPTTTTTVPRTTSTTVVDSTTTTTREGASTTTTLTLCGKGGDAPCGGVATGGGFSALNAQVAPGPIETVDGSGWGWIMAGASLFMLGLATLVGGYAHAWWRGRNE